MKKLMIAFIAVPLFAFTSKPENIKNIKEDVSCSSSCGSAMDFVDEWYFGGDMPWSDWMNGYNACVDDCQSR